MELFELDVPRESNGPQVSESYVVHFDPFYPHY